MDAQNSPVDVRIAEIAARQYGVIAWRQLIALGLGRGGITRRIASGRLHPLHEGVYAVGHPIIGRSGRWMAAALAFGPDAVLSHITAAQAWGILKASDARPHVTSAARSLVGRPGIVLHRVRSLDPALTTEVDRLPVTTVPRVLLDLAAARDTHPLRRAWEGAQRQGLLHVPAVAELCANSPGRRVKPLRALIEEAEDAPDTIEEFEARFADLIRQYGLPRPAHNVLVHDYLVDAVWLEQGLIVELDSRQYHWNTRERDSERDVELGLQGYFTYRVTWRALTREPARVAARIAGLLDRSATATWVKAQS